VTESNETFDMWAVVELMGHRRMAGRVTEQTVAGTALLRIDIPSDPPVTQLYGGSAIYCITPTTEEIARAVALHNQPQPVHRWELAAPQQEESYAGGLRVEPEDDFDIDVTDQEAPF